MDVAMRGMQTRTAPDDHGDDVAGGAHVHELAKESEGCLSAISDTLSGKCSRQP